MVSLVLGLIVIGGVISVVLSNRRSYNSTEGLSQVQESARTAFELLARDIRQSAGNGCDNTAGTANVLRPSAAWWRDWYGLRGFDGTDVDPAVADGTAIGQRIAGTDSIHTQGIDGVPLPLEIHNAAGGRLEINAATTPFGAGDVMMVCDFDHAAIFQASAYDPGTSSVFHAEGVLAPGPGNCSQGLGFPTDCGSVTGNVYTFARNSAVGRMAAVAWYVGANGRPADGGRSLYRRRLAPGGLLVTEEVVAGVTNLRVTYGVNGSELIRDGSVLGSADWPNVNSVFVELTADSADTNVSTNATVNNGRFQKTFSYLITLRNRVP